jgi:hypothetical protein
MTVNINGNPLWKKQKTYKCGCAVIEGKFVCPVHGEPILEQQMIYGNKSEQEYLNEKEQYQRQNLNE